MLNLESDIHSTGVKQSIDYADGWAGYKNPGANYRELEVRKNGSEVTLTGLVRSELYSGPTGFVHVATLPSDLWPKRRIIRLVPSDAYALDANTSHTRLDITADGLILLNVLQVNTELWFSAEFTYSLN